MSTHREWEGAAGDPAARLAADLNGRFSDMAERLAARRQAVAGGNEMLDRLLLGVEEQVLREMSISTRHAVDTAFATASATVLAGRRHRRWFARWPKWLMSVVSRLSTRKRSTNDTSGTVPGRPDDGTAAKEAAS